MGHIYNLSSEAGRFLVGSLPKLQSEFKASLSYIVVCLKNTSHQKREKGVRGDEKEGDRQKAQTIQREKETHVAIPALPPAV